MLNFYNEPKVALKAYFSNVIDNAVAAARSCYAPRIITDEDVRKNPEQRDRIAQSTYQATHHTTLQHAHYQFTIEGVSRQAIWAFFHAHPFYNSEQVSQRYVEVKPEAVVRPQGSKTAEEIYNRCVQRQMQSYRQLCSLLEPLVAKYYFDIFPARNRVPLDKRWQGSIVKKAQEVARYVLPIGTTAHMYHTISALTLYRYHRAMLLNECPSEVSAVVKQMVAAVIALDPSFALLLEEPLDVHPEQSLGWMPNKPIAQRTKLLFPQSGHDLTSTLTQALSIAVNRQLSEDDAINFLFDPRRNAYLGQSLNIGTLTTAQRVLDTVHLTYAKKLSHTADSQEQRHRMVPGARPRLAYSDTLSFVTPSLLLQPGAEQANDLFQHEMANTQRDFEECFKCGEPEMAQYLLPNAVEVSFVSAGSLLDLQHKWSTRLCLNAQDEIWQSTMEEIDELHAIAPKIASRILPPCGMRHAALKTPVCPEGDRYCGVQVWKKPRSSLLRVL